MNEDTTSQNDELVTTQSDDETLTETEETTSPEELEDESLTLTRAELEQRLREARKDQDRRWKDRIKGLKSDEDGKEGGAKSREDGVATKEELDRFRLEAKGIEDKAAQDFILKYAKLEGMSVQDALRDEIVQAKMQKMTADTERNRATNSPVNRTGRPREKTPEELARLAEQGKLPQSKEERKAALKALQAKYGRT